MLVIDYRASAKHTPKTAALSNLPFDWIGYVPTQSMTIRHLLPIFRWPISIGVGVLFAHECALLRVIVPALALKMVDV